MRNEPVAKLARYQVCFVPVSEIKPSPENEELYGEVSFNTDPALPMLKESIRKKGLEEPLILTRDNYILSGHRRFQIVTVLGLERVACRYVDFKRSEIRNIHKLLAEYNPQRVKSAASIMAENFLLSEKAKMESQSWTDYHKKATCIEIESVQVSGHKETDEIGERQQEFLESAKRVIYELESFWPLTVRQIHYGLLNDPPLTQVTQDRNERWRYRNDLPSYGKASRLLVAARYAGIIPWSAIADATRETQTFFGWESIAKFIESQTRNFLNGYCRHRQEAQPHMVVGVLEKNTLVNLVSDVFENFHIPFVALRGYGGPSIWHDLHMRWLKKRETFPRAKLILIFISDHDPEGFDLMDDAVRSLRDRHFIEVEAVRAAVTMEQIKKFQIASNPAKDTSARFSAYVKRTNTKRTWECESLKPELLRQSLHNAILSALNRKRLKQVQDMEGNEIRQLEKTRARVAMAIKKILLGGEL